MAPLQTPVTHETLIPLIAALLEAERRIAMLERRLADARWLGPGEQPNDNDKAVARERVVASIGALVNTSVSDDDY